MASPIVADGTVYSVSHEVTALDAKNGDLRWSFDLDGKADHTPALLDDVLIVAADHQLVGLNPGDGEVVWTRSLPKIATGSLTASTNPSLVTVPVGDRKLHAFDPDSGDRLWQVPIAAVRQAALAHESVYMTGYRPDEDSGVLLAVSATDARPLWDVDLTNPDAPPVVAEEGIVVADQGTVSIHDPADGTRQVVLGSFGAPVAVSPSVIDGTAYIAGGSGGLAAVSMDDGSILWSNNVQVTVDTGISVGSSAVVVPVSDLPNADLPGIVAFERSDGSHRWEHSIEGFDSSVSTPAALADGAVFYSSNESLGVVALGDLFPEND